MGNELESVLKNQIKSAVCSIPVAIRKLQIQLLWDHISLSHNSCYQENNKKHRWGRMEKRWRHRHCRDEIGNSCYGNQTKLAYDPVVALPGMYLRGLSQHTEKLAQPCLLLCCSQESRYGVACLPTTWGLDIKVKSMHNDALLSRKGKWICREMGLTVKQPRKWRNSDSEKQTTFLLKCE